MWKFLIDIYITQPRAKHEGRFKGLWFFIFLSGGMSLIQINYILYPAPELSELSYVEGKLIKVIDNTGGRHPTVYVIVLTANNKEKKIVVSTVKEDVVLYKKYLGSVIQVWYRLNGYLYSAVKVILDDQIFHHYSKKKQIKKHDFSLISFYPFIALIFYALFKPWLVLIVQKIKERKHNL